MPLIDAMQGIHASKKSAVGQFAVAAVDDRRFSTDGSHRPPLQFSKLTHYQKSERPGGEETTKIALPGRGVNRQKADSRSAGAGFGGP